MSEVLKSNVVLIIVGAIITLIFVIIGWIIRTMQFNKGMKNQQTDIEKIVQFETAKTQKQGSSQFIADKRLDWIVEVRDTMSDFLSLAAFAVDHYIMEDLAVPKEMFRELSHSILTIKLLINFDELLDMKIVKVAEGIYRNLSSDKFGHKLFNEEFKNLTMYSQIYLKLEWERIKLESEGIDKIAVKEALVQREKYLTKSYELREDNR